MSSKILVAYFSASGVTARAAEEIAGALGADLFEIRPSVPYTAADLNWMDKKSRSTLEMNDPSSRPPMAQPAPDLAQYDTVLVGFPVWWGVEPRIVDTFLESGDFSSKTMIAFATSGGAAGSATRKRACRAIARRTGSPGKLVSAADAADWAKTLR